jgi:hypothetical protein
MGGRGLKYQTNPELGPFLNKWGCFHNSILCKLEKHAKGYRFTNDDVRRVYVTAMRHGVVQEEAFDGKGKPIDGCDILDHMELYNLAAVMFGIRSRCVEYRVEKPDYHTKPNEEEILELKRNGLKGSHFVCGNGSFGVPVKARVEFDPIEGGSNCARDGWIESIRIMVIKDGIG